MCSCALEEREARFGVGPDYKGTYLARQIRQEFITLDHVSLSLYHYIIIIIIVCRKMNSFSVGYILVLSLFLKNRKSIGIL